jgi:hypothetical protein
MVAVVLCGIYKQSCIKRSPLEQRKSGLIRQLTLKITWNTHLCACPKPGLGFPMSYVVINEWRWGVIVRFLDLGVIGDHQLSLSKLSFHNEIINLINSNYINIYTFRSSPSLKIGKLPSFSDLHCTFLYC